MRHLVPIFALMAGPAVSQDIPVPSDLSVTLQDVILEPDPGIARFRFVVASLGQAGAQSDDLVADVQYLCDTVAVPALIRAGRAERSIVISVANQPTDLGDFDADTVQYFTGFSVEDGVCVVDLF